MISSDPAMSPIELPQTSDQEALRFGSFVLFPQRYLLLKQGEPVALGSRALELLIALTSRPGELLEKSELMTRAWPRVIVEECNLRAQIVALRRTLREPDAGECIATVPGRGYRFIAPVHAHKEWPSASSLSLNTQPAPRLMSEAIGRELVITGLCSQLEQGGLITLVGPGGVGKSAIALAVHDRLVTLSPDNAIFVDLSHTPTPPDVHALLGHVLGVAASDGQVRPPATAVQTRGLTLVLDNCEEALDATAELVEALLRQVPGCAILATSREPLRAEGEQVQRLEPLELPATDGGASAEQVLGHSAIRLFIERVKRHDAGFVLGEDDLVAVVRICRMLEGMPLDIELAAARVSTFGLAALEELLSGDFRLQMEGRRTAPPRHRSLRASADWCYQRLTLHQQSMLRLVAVFNGNFTLKAVRAISRGDPRFKDVDPLQLVEDLVDKSLLIAQRDAAERHYRMLSTTRIYAMRKLEEEGGVERIIARHAAYALAVVKEAANQLDAVAPDAWKSLYGAESDTVRSALAWAWSPQGNQSLGLDLTLAALGLRPQHVAMPQQPREASPRHLRVLR